MRILKLSMKNRSHGARKKYLIRKVYPRKKYPLGKKYLLIKEHPLDKKYPLTKDNGYTANYDFKFYLKKIMKIMLFIIVIFCLIAIFLFLTGQVVYAETVPMDLFDSGEIHRTPLPQTGKGRRVEGFYPVTGGHVQIRQFGYISRISHVFPDDVRNQLTTGYIVGPPGTNWPLSSKIAAIFYEMRDSSNVKITQATLGQDVYNYTRDFYQHKYNKPMPTGGLSIGKAIINEMFNA